jgi:hypothetical protein
VNCYGATGKRPMPFPEKSPMFTRPNPPPLDHHPKPPFVSTQSTRHPPADTSQSCRIGVTPPHHPKIPTGRDVPIGTKIPTPGKKPVLCSGHYEYLSSRGHGVSSAKHYLPIVVATVSIQRSRPKVKSTCHGGDTGLVYRPVALRGGRGANARVDWRWPTGGSG